MARRAFRGVKSSVRHLVSIRENWQRRQNNNHSFWCLLKPEGLWWKLDKQVKKKAESRPFCSRRICPSTDLTVKRTSKTLRRWEMTNVSAHPKIVRKGADEAPFLLSTPHLFDLKISVREAPQPRTAALGPRWLRWNNNR